MKLNPNALPFDFTLPKEDSKRSRRYDLEQMLNLKPYHVRVLPEMQKHEHAKSFLRPMSYDLPYLLALKPKHQQPPAVIPPWFSMIYYNHYCPGAPLPVLPKSEEVRVMDGRSHERVKDSGDVRLADLRVEIPKPKWSLREVAVHKKASPFKKHGHNNNSEPPSKSKRSQAKKHQDKQSAAIPLQDLELHHSDNRWQAQPSSGEAAVAEKGITMILNKLSEENFERLVKQTVAIPVTSFATFSLLAEHVFNKAIEEPNFAQLYARFCASLSELLPSFVEGSRTLDFRFTLLMLCHKYLVEQELDLERLMNVSPESKAEEELKLWNRRKGNIILIGQLFTKQLLAKPVIHNCVEMLLKADEEEEEGEEMEAAPPSDTDVECVCILLKTIGPLLDTQEDKDVSRGGRDFNRMDGYFERIQSLSVHLSLPHRLRFMLRDLIELRQRNWDKPLSSNNTTNNSNYPQGSPSTSPRKWRSKTASGKPSPLPTPTNATRPKLNLSKPSHSRSNSASDMFVISQSLSTPKHEQKRNTESRRGSISPPVPLDKQASCTSLPSTPRSQHKVTMLVKEYYTARSVSEATQCIRDCHQTHLPLSAQQQTCDGCEVVKIEVVYQAIVVMFDGGEDHLPLCQTLLSSLKSQNTLTSEHLIAGIGRVLRSLADVALDIPLAPTLLTSICSHLLRSNDIARPQLEAEVAAVDHDCEGSTLPREVISRCFQ